MGINNKDFLSLIDPKPQMVALAALPASHCFIPCEGLEQPQDWRDVQPFWAGPWCNQFPLNSTWNNVQAPNSCCQMAFRIWAMSVLLKNVFHQDEGCCEKTRDTNSGHKRENLLYLLYCQEMMDNTAGWAGRGWHLKELPEVPNIRAVSEEQKTRSVHIPCQPGIAHSHSLRLLVPNVLGFPVVGSPSTGDGQSLMHLSSWVLPVPQLPTA